MIDQHFGMPAIAALPAVSAYAALRAKGAGIDADLRRIELEMQQAQLDQNKLLGSMNGEKLAIALGEAQDREAAAQQRLQTAQNGLRIFGAKLNEAESAARGAIVNHFKAVILPKIIADFTQASAKAWERLMKAAGPGLDELASFEQTGMLLGTGLDNRVGGHVEELLRKIK